MPDGTPRRTRLCLFLCPILLAGCGLSSVQTPGVLVRADEPAALAALPGGGLVFGGRTNGVVQEVTSAGRLLARPLARVAVSSAGQRGLLSLAVGSGGRLVAAWTRPDRRLVVGQVAPGPIRLIWLGPFTATLGNGGHLVFAPDGRLVIGIGDMEQPRRTLDPHYLNGKLLSLSPSGPPDQRPRLISSGWTNPFAFAYTPAGVLRVADNSAGPGPERIAVGNAGASAVDVSMTAGETAPSGLAVLDEQDFVVCGYVSGRLDRYRVGADGGPRIVGRPLAGDCRLGVVRLSSGALAYATTRDIRLLPRPGG